MRAAIYMRVSTDEQVDGYSLAAQERACRAYAASKGWTDVAIYADEGDSAFKDTQGERPALRRMIADYRSGRVGAVIVHKLDRFFRRTKLLLDTVEDMEQRGVIFASVCEQIDFSTPIGRVMLTSLGGFAEYYSRNLATETKKGLREKADQGHWVGPLPLGYRKDEAGQLVPSDDAPAVQLMFQLYATGAWSYTQIADELNRRGWRSLRWQTGRRALFGRETIRTILGNRAYLGFVSCAGVEYQGQHAPLITNDVWQAVQRVRDERTHHPTHPASDAPSDAWLNGRIFCLECHRLIWHHTAWKAKHGGTLYRYYRCSGISNRVCGAKMVRAEHAEADMLHLLKQLTLPADLRNVVVQEAEQIATTLHTPPTGDSVGNLEAKLKRLGRVYADGVIGDDEYQRTRDALRLQLHAARPAEPNMFARDAALALLGDLPTLLDAATAHERRMVLRSLFSEIWVRNAEIHELTPRADVYPLVASIVRCVSGVADGYQLPCSQPSASCVILRMLPPLHGAGRAAAA